MKTLLLMRHGKSSWKERGLKDHKRPLSKRGRRNSPAMGECLREKDLLPQLILCSTAVRARQTAELLMEGSSFTGQVKYLDELYLSDPDKILGILQKAPDRYDRVMVVGHNPELEDLLSLLAHRVEKMTTAAIAGLELPVNAWSELDRHTKAKLVDIWRPKEIEAEEAE